jgi:hypothetical protein
MSRALACTLVLIAFANASVTLSVVCTDTDVASCTVQPAGAEVWTAKAVFDDKTNQTGWGAITVETNATAPDSIAAFAAGYVEGAVTPVMINLAWQNFMTGDKSAYPSSKVIDFIAENNKYVQKQIENGARDEYWESVSLVYAQLAGLTAGYNAHRGGLNPLTPMQMQLLGMTVELDDIQKAVDPSSRPRYEDMTKSELDGFVFDHTHCSAMIKVTADLSELFSSHNTWCGYNGMLRLFKT